MYNLDNIIKNTGIMVDSITSYGNSYPKINGYIVDNTAWETVCSDRTITNINTTQKENWLYNDSITATPSPSPVLTINQGTKTVLDDVEIRGQITIPNGKVEKLIIEEDDIIMLTFDLDELDLDSCHHFFDMWVQAFPNHKIISNIKGIKIDLIKDKGRKNNEVSW